VTDADPAGQALHVPFMDHVADETAAAPDMELLPIARHEAGRILAAVLEDGEGLVEIHIDLLDAGNTHDSAHLR
jgi:hypothetical protein